MSTPSKNTPANNVVEAEKMLVATILTHIGHLLIAKSPVKSKAKEEAERYRGQLLSKMTSEERTPFLQTREIIVELVTLLAKSQTREILGKVMTYLRQLNKGEIYLVDEPDEAGIKRKLGEFFERQNIEFNDAALSEIIRIVVNVIPQAEYEAETTEESQ
ncbi:hypothetical protein [Spirosoma pomorum]